MDMQNNDAKKLDADQLEAVSGGTTLKEAACLLRGKHKRGINNASAFEIIGTDRSHTLYYYEECPACGSKYYFKYDCSAQKKASISMEEYTHMRQVFGTQSC